MPRPVRSGLVVPACSGIAWSPSRHHSRERLPTTDTYSAPSTQQEFFFRLPFETMDLLWYAQEHDVPLPEVAQAMGLTEVQVQRAFDDFTRKQRTTQYLRMPPLGIADDRQ